MVPPEPSDGIGFLPLCTVVAFSLNVSVILVPEVQELGFESGKGQARFESARQEALSSQVYELIPDLLVLWGGPPCRVRRGIGEGPASELGMWAENSLGVVLNVARNHNANGRYVQQWRISRTMASCSTSPVLHSPFGTIKSNRLRETGLLSRNLNSVTLIQIPEMMYIHISYGHLNSGTFRYDFPDLHIMLLMVTEIKLP